MLSLNFIINRDETFLTAMWAPFFDWNLTSNRNTFPAAHYTAVFSQQFLLTRITCGTQHFSSLWTPVSGALLFQGIVEGIAKLASENGKFIVKRRKSQSGLLFEEKFCFPGERGTFLLGWGGVSSARDHLRVTSLVPRPQRIRACRSNVDKKSNKVHTMCQLPLGAGPC